MQLLDMRPDHIELVQRILRQHVPSAEVLAFGSRAKWLARDTSDLDLCIRATAALSFEKMGTLREAFEESNLPYKVDVVDWATTSESFRKIIERDKVVVQKTTSHQCRLGGVGLAGEETVRLRDVCVKIGSGATPRGGKEAYKGGATTLIRSQNIYNEGFHRDGLVYIDDDQSADLRNVEVKPNDVLLNITGDSVARCCQVAADVLPARVNQHVAIIRPEPKSLDPRFLRYVLVSQEYQSRLLALASAGATRPALTKSMIEELDIPSPPLAEQKAIASILGSLDDKIELNRRMNATLEAMARALFQSWFVDFDPVRAKLEGRPPAALDPATTALFPDSFEESELGLIPKGWKAKPLSELCQLGRGASPRPINDYMNGEIPWIKIADATAAGGPFLFETKENVKKEGAEKSVAVAPGDLILSNSATCGVPMFVELHGCIHDGWLYFKNLRSISKIYLFHVLIELAEHLIYIADGSVQKNLNTNLVGQQNVLVPPKAIAEAFDAQATVLFAKMRKNGLESRTLATLRDTLLPKLLSGELRVPDAQQMVEKAV